MKRQKKDRNLILTYRFRIKGASAKRRLLILASQVNRVWNFCNETSFNAIRNHGKWISSKELDALVAGTSKLTGLHSQSVQGVSQEYFKQKKETQVARLQRIQKIFGMDSI